MNKQQDGSAKALRRALFDAEIRELSGRVDSAVSRLDAGSPQQAVKDAETLIGEAGRSVEALAAGRMSGDLEGAVADVAGSVNYLSDLAVQKADSESKLAFLPSCDGVRVTVAVLCIVGALVALFTELKLTDALVDLLGYRRDDPTGRAIGAAFASALLVFELVFARLGLAADPWPLFHRSDPAPVGHSQWSRRAGGVALILALLGVASLQVLTVIKMAPTRSIDASYQRGHRDLTPREDRTVEESTLLFSVCLLVSGGFMAAAGTTELSLWLRRNRLHAEIREAEGQRLRMIAELSKDGLPKLAGELEEAGMAQILLSTEGLSEIPRRLNEAFGNRARGDGAHLAGRAAAEARMFESQKRIDLQRALAKPAERRNAKSWRDTVDEALGNAA